MVRVRVVHRCSSCGAAHPKWAGRGDSCGEWNSLVEELDSSARSAVTLPDAAIPLRVTEVDDEAARSVPTGIGEFDRVLGGGLVPGSVTLVGGEPGIGKTTALRAAQNVDKTLITGVTLFDVYDGAGVGEGQKSLGLEVVLQPRDKTLTDEEIEAVAEKITAAVAKATGGRLRE